MRTGLCPKCGSRMIEGAFEEIVELENGFIQMETIYSAWVCSDFVNWYQTLLKIFLTFPFAKDLKE